MSGNLTSGTVVRDRGATDRRVHRDNRRKQLRGVVLAGIHAWGECMLEEVLTRPLWPVAGEPLIGHVLKWLRRGGVRRTSICGNGHTHDLLQAVGLRQQGELRIDYYEDRMPRGPAGCARDAALRSDAERFLVVDATVIPDLDLAAMVEAHESGAAGLTMAVTTAKTDQGMAIADSVEPVGVYIFERRALERVSRTGYQDIKESLIPRLRGDNIRVVGFEVVDAGAPRVRCPSSYLAANRWLLDRLSLAGQRDLPPDFDWVAPEADVHKDARFVGPVQVGPGTCIGRDALVVGPTTIGRNCVVGDGAIIARSALWDGVRVGPGAVVDHCILTEAAVLDGALELRDTVLIPPSAQARKSWWRRRRGGRKAVTPAEGAGTSDAGVVGPRDASDPAQVRR